MAKLVYDRTGRLLFTKEMKREYTLLFPMMAPIHFRMLGRVFEHFGYKTALLTSTNPEIAQTGLKYVHNDTCYPAILVIGQLIDGLQSGKYDLDKVALMITQTGGGCRASNYIHLLRKALRKAGLEKIPVISVNMAGMEYNPGFRMSLSLIRRAMSVLLYGDMLMLLRNQTRPYETGPGRSESLVESWSDRLLEQMNRGRGCSVREIRRNLEQMVLDFAAVPRKDEKKVKVGVVGEIYVKYAALGNNNLEDFLAAQDCEVNMPGILGFILYIVYNGIEDYRLYGGSRLKYWGFRLFRWYFTRLERQMIEALWLAPQYVPPTGMAHAKQLSDRVIGGGVKMGEGWLLTAEMLELVETGYENIICTQPFGCLPNHICGRGMIRKIKEQNARANIVAIDYDPGATRVNQENRIKLMLSIARENLAAAQEAPAEDRPQEALAEESGGVLAQSGGIV